MSRFPTAIKLKGNTTQLNLSTVATYEQPQKTFLSLVLICCRSTCDMAADTACNTTPTYEDITPPATRNIAGLKPLAFLRSRS